MAADAALIAALAGTRPAARRAPARRARAATFTPIGKLLVFVLIVGCTYDKSGFIASIGGRAVSLSYHQLLLLGAMGFAMLGAILVPTSTRGQFHRPLFRLLIAFVVIQTLASLAGLYFAPGARNLSSEVYHFIQRAHFLVIPLLALRYQVSRRVLLKWFFAAIVVHLLAVAVQFGSPGMYRAAVDVVHNPIRLDNTYEWIDELSYIGLLRTGNYGQFTAVFGLVALAWTPKRRSTRLLRALVVAASLWIAVTGNSRSAVLMALVATTVFVLKTGALARLRSYAWLIVVVLTSGCVVMIVRPPAQLAQAIYAFTDPDRSGSNQGKLMIMDYGLTLFAGSPWVGYGARRFADLTEPLGNTSAFMTEAHSFALSTVLAGGLVGLVMYCLVFLGVARRLFRGTGKDDAVVFGLFLGLGLYNIIYDAGGLDVFATFNGVAAYYALTVPARVARRRAAPPPSASVRAQPS